MDGEKMTMQALRERVVDDLLQEDAYYQAISSSLKTAETCKAEHKACLEEAVKMEDFQNELNEAVRILIEQMPGFVGEQAWKEILDECPEYSFSKKSFDHIYKLGRSLLERKCFNEAHPIFLFMICWNPKIPEYWLGIGIALYSVQKLEESIAFLKIASILKPQSVSPLIYTCLSHLKLGDREEASKVLNEILKKPPNEKEGWSNEITFIQNQLNKS